VKTDKAKLNDLVAQILKEEAKEKRIREKKRKLLVQAQELADEHRAEWFGDDKSIRLSNGKAVYLAVSESVAGEHFDLEEFREEFPNLFEFKAKYNIPSGKLRVILEDPEKAEILENLTVSIDTKERFKVEP